MNNFDYMKLAVYISSNSRDRSTKVGAVIVKEDSVISSGYNEFPRRIDDDRPERYERPQKYLFTEHAERNAIYNAARMGISLDGSSIYISTGFSCANCARAIIQSGIWRVYINGEDFLLNGEKWVSRWKEEMDAGIAMMTESGVSIYLLSGDKIECLNNISTFDVASLLKGSGQ